MSIKEIKRIEVPKGSDLELVLRRLFFTAEVKIATLAKAVGQSVEEMKKIIDVERLKGEVEEVMDRIKADEIVG